MIRALALAAALALPLAARAETAPAPATAGFLVLDTERLATEATAMKSVFDQIARRRDVEAAAYNMALDKLDKEFEPVKQAESTMDPAEYRKAAEQYDGVRKQIDDVLAKVQDEMNAAAEKAIEQFNAAATAAGDQIRKERGITRFVDGAAVLYVRPGSGYDATDEVIRRVNASLPDIKVNFPARKPVSDKAEPAAKKK